MVGFLCKIKCIEKNRTLNSILGFSIIIICSYIIILRTESEVVRKEDVIEISLYTGRIYLEVCVENTEDFISILNRIKFIFISVTAIAGFDTLKKYFENTEKSSVKGKISKKTEERKTEEFFV